MPRFPLSDPLHHPQSDALILVLMPMVTTESTLTVDLSLYGLDPELYADGFARVLNVHTLLGVAANIDDPATINSNGELVITEGVTGFTTGNQYLVAVAKQRIIEELGVAT